MFRILLLGALAESLVSSFFIHHNLVGPVALFLCNCSPWIDLPFLFLRGYKLRFLPARLMASFCFTAASFAWALHIHHLILEMWLWIALAAVVLLSYVMEVIREEIADCISYMLWGIGSDIEY
ncbi:hypothetical protein KJ616_01930 [Patescibacteria group bacterium]|nr:hypothetical protein [Patescibacteria group bacterium]